MIYIALPVLEEFKNLPALIHCLRKQRYQDFSLYVCVNQPKEWWQNEAKQHSCVDNQKSIEYLKNIDFSINIFDKSSPEKAWGEKKSGVGHARKLLIDEIASTANDKDIIVSLDADTSFNKNYIQSIVDSFSKHDGKIAMAVPYYHKLLGNEIKDRAILRYEIYLRTYSINLLRIENPYSFTALGSAIALPVWAYKKIRGIKPLKSGEDFYFLQKLTKSGNLILWNSEKVFPKTRFSDRVLFGTGPAMKKITDGDSQSYPIFDYRFFDEIEQTYKSFEDLYSKDIDSPMLNFLTIQFGDRNWIETLRKNCSNEKTFMKSCMQKVDGLRILQYLKFRNKTNKFSDEENFIAFLKSMFDEKNLQRINETLYNFSFSTTPISKLDEIRDLLVKKEEKYQKSSLTRIIHGVPSKQ